MKIFFVSWFCSVSVDVYVMLRSGYPAVYNGFLFAHLFKAGQSFGAIRAVYKPDQIYAEARLHIATVK